MWTEPRGESHDDVTLIPLAWLLSLSCFWLFYLSTHLSPEGCTFCPASDGTVAELELVLLGAPLSCLPILSGVRDFFFAFWNSSPHPPVCAGLPSQAAVRGAERVQPSPTPQTLRQPPCPALADTARSRARRASQAVLLTAHSGKVAAGKAQRIQKQRSTFPFLPSLSRSCLLYWSFPCLLACVFLLGNRYGALGPGPCGHQRVFHSRCVS